MKAFAVALKNDENGMIVSAELAIVLTVSVLAMVVGLNGVAGSVSSELNDLSSAFGTLDQTFIYRGMSKFNHASVAGSAFIDGRDFCDCTAIWRNGATTHGSYGYGYGAGIAAPPAVQGPALVNPCPSGDCPPAAKPCDNCEPAEPAKPTEEAPQPAPSKTPADT
jgi:hypothetical protein